MMCVLSPKIDFQLAETVKHLVYTFVLFRNTLQLLKGRVLEAESSQGHRIGRCSRCVEKCVANDQTMVASASCP